MSKYTAAEVQEKQQQTRKWLEEASKREADDLNQQEVEELRALIRFQEYRYYVVNDPLLTDPEFDRLYKLLQQAEHAYPDWITPDSPTQRVGSDLSEHFPEMAHLTPMLSLENSYNENDLLEFDRRVRELSGHDQLTYTVEPKFDGTGISLIYEDDQLKMGISRGDGQVGEDITPNVRTIRTVPLRAKFSRWNIIRAELRGEILMSKEAFGELNQARQDEGKAPFANPRNVTAGTMRLLDPREVARRKLTCFTYHLAYAADPKGRNQLGDAIQSNKAALDMLAALGFYTPLDTLQVFSDMQEVMRYCQEFEARRDDYPFEVDGMVVKVNNLILREEIGYTSHHPRWAMAYKFKARQGRSTLEKVEFQVGRIGTITPVAKIRPVEVAGVQVSSVSMFNEDFIREKDLHIGDVVIVERAGDVIPYIVRVDVSARKGDEQPVAFPRVCPACQTPLERGEEEAAWRCINLNCPAQLQERLKHFVSKDAMDIAGLGTNNIRRFYRHGLIAKLTDLYRLDYNQIRQMEGFGEKSVENLRAAIEASRSRSLDRLLFALGIRFVGVTTARALAKEVTDLRAFYAWKQEDFEQIPDIGPRMAESIAAFFHNPAGQKLIEELASLGVTISQKPSQKPVEKEGVLSGKTFLFTGALQKMARNEAQQTVETLGGKILSTVSKNLDYLVVGESPGSKLKKAERLGTVEILSEEDFQEMVSEA